MPNATVTVHRLQSPHQSSSFTEFQPLNLALCEELFSAVAAIFDAAGGAGLLKKSGDVYLKPNGIDSKPYAHTRPELLEAVFRYWRERGARRIFLFENATQSNFTRMVFAITGYSKICRQYGVKEVYLDEEKSVRFEFKGRLPAAENSGGYCGTTFEIPLFIVDNLIERADENLYINLPKLKTHSMAGVTLGIKNQWAFPQQNDRRSDHNYNLPHKLVDVLGYIQPDFTLIEGVEGTVHGHYPVTRFADECVKPFRVLIGSDNVVAADLAGARLFGLTAEDVPHLEIAMERGDGKDVKSFEDIEIIGDISDFDEKYETDLLPKFPDDVTVLKGKERLCREGCKNNPLTLLQVLAYDYGGKGGWTMVMGKGHDPAEIDAVMGRVLVMGRCARAEIGDRLIRRLGKKNVYFSGHCNDLCATLNAMCHLMGVSPLKLAPMPFIQALGLFMASKLRGTKANIPFLLADKIKAV